MDIRNHALGLLRVFFLTKQSLLDIIFVNTTGPFGLKRSSGFDASALVSEAVRLARL
jgi:hypothetical protein